MGDSSYKRATDLSNLNWKGWILVLITIVTMFTSIVFGMMTDGIGSNHSRGENKILGVIFAFAAFGGFVSIASIMHYFGHSIYKKGYDPFDKDVIDKADNCSAAKSLAGSAINGELNSETIETISDGSTSIASNFNPTNLV